MSTYDLLAMGRSSIELYSNDVESAVATLLELGPTAVAERTTVIYIECDRYEGVPDYESWWDVPVAEVSESAPVEEARRKWEKTRGNERYFLRNEGSNISAE